MSILADISGFILHSPHINAYQSAGIIKQAAEERRKNPPRKIVTIFYNKDKRLYSTYAHAPKLLLDQPQEDELSHYAVVFSRYVVLHDCSNIINGHIFID